VLPENFAFMGPDSERSSHAEVLGDVDAPIQRALSSLARRHAVFVVGGGMPERSDNPECPFNTSVVFDPSGTLVGRFRNVHLLEVVVG
jgi:predicted amidohydrolase